MNPPFLILKLRRKKGKCFLSSMKFNMLNSFDIYCKIFSFKLALSLRARSSVWNVWKIIVISQYWFAAQQTSTLRRQNSGSFYSEVSVEWNEFIATIWMKQEMAQNCKKPNNVRKTYIYVFCGLIVNGIINWCGIIWMLNNNISVTKEWV